MIFPALIFESPGAAALSLSSERVLSMRSLVERLAAQGAVLLTDPTQDALLIGDVRWHERGDLLIFAAFGDGLRDVRSLTPDTIFRLESGDVALLAGGRTLGRICSIDTAGLPDPDDYRIAWQLWQQVQPLQRQRIERCFELVEARSAKL